MFAVTLIARPGGLAEETVAARARAWGGTDPVWLSPGEAAEIRLSAMPGDAAEAAEALRADGVDLAVQPEAGRRKRLLLADMDSTMIEQECIDELAEEAGVGDRVRDITARAMNGELDFEGALRERVGLLKGLGREVIGRVLRDRITLAPGGRTLVATMQAHGGYCALISGGFTEFTGEVARRLGFDEHRANRLLIERDRLTGEVVPPILGREAKVAALNDLCDRLGIGAAEAAVVGDGANDLGMIGLAGLGVALHAKPTVAAAAPVRIDHGDLTALLYLQGYARSDFA